MDKELTIITVCYQAREQLEKTIRAILEQDTEIYEYIIIDGGSKDGTAELVRGRLAALRKKIQRVQFISEPDNGIYNAMNKGIAYSHGKWIYFLNAGDVFYENNVLKALQPYFETDADVIYGDNLMVMSNNENRLYSAGGDCSQIRKRNFFSHQSAFVRRKWLEKEPFNEKYRISADYDSFLHIYLQGGKFVYTGRIHCRTSAGGISMTGYFWLCREAAEIKYRRGVISWRQFYIQALYYNVCIVLKKGKDWMGRKLTK